MPIHYRPTVAEIDLNALRHNAQALRKRLPAGTRTLAIVKANAYGHGAVHCARTLKGCGVEGLGVATLEEAMELRNAGIAGDILVLDGILSESLDEYFDFRLKPVIHRAEDLTRLGQHAKSKGKPIGIHIKVDTGMGRLGFWPEQLEELLPQLRQYSELKVEGVLTHLARADEEDPEPTEEQYRRFSRVQEIFSSHRVAAPFHIANSAAILDGRVAPESWVRPGIMLYGAYPNPRQKALADLKPVMTLKTKVLSVKRYPAGTPVSYGATFVTQRDSVLGVLPLGYADGYPRQASNRAQALVREIRVPVVGRVCMDLMLVDLTAVPGAAAGDEAVLFGAQGTQVLRAEEVAAWADTISYEIFCRVSARVPRVYTGS